MRVTVTTEIRICNHCKKRSTEGAEFNEYSEGERNYAGKIVDLCDECVATGYFIQRFEAGVVAVRHEDDEA